MNNGNHRSGEVHPSAGDGRRELPSGAARILTRAGGWLFSYSSSLLVASLVTGGLQGGGERVLALVSASAGLTALGRWAHRRTGRSPTGPDAPLPPSPPATQPDYGTPPPLPRPRPAPTAGDVTTLYRVLVPPGSGHVQVMPLIEIRHEGQAGDR